LLLGVPRTSTLALRGSQSKTLVELNGVKTYDWFWMSASLLF
jgi:hypothetical protein